MGADQNIELIVSAKAQLGEAQKQISTFLKEIEDKTDSAGKKSGSLTDGFKAFTGHLGSALPIAGAAIAAIGAGIGTVVVGIGALGAKGAEIADIRAQFDILNASIGNNANTMLGSLRSATAGTITDFELMKSVNIGLSQGLKLNAGDMELTGKAARVLADRVGGDTKTAFDTLIGAMATGKDATLKGIGANIDAAAAADKFAASIGKEASELTEAEKKIATKNAILLEMNRVLAESGEAEIDFADAIDIAKTKLGNFVNGISEGIANSPVLGAAINAVGKELSAAFGGSTDSLIKNIIKGIEFGAITMVEWGRTAVTVTGIIIQVFGGVSTVVNGLMTLVTGVATAFAQAIATIANLATKLPVVGDSFKGIASAATTAANGMKSVTSYFAENTKTAAQMTMGHSALHTTLDNIDGALGRVRNSMVDASGSSDQETVAVNGLTGALGGLTAGTNAATGATGGLTKAQKDAADAAEQHAAWRRKHLEDEGVAIMKAYDERNKAQAEATKKSLAEKDAAALVYLDREKKLHEESLALDAAYQKVLSEARNAAGLALMEADAKRMKSGYTKIFSDLPNVIMGAFTGGGDVGKAIGGSVFGKLFDAKGVIGKQFQEGGAVTGWLAGTSIGKKIGESLGSLMGPLGTMLGGLAGKLLGPLVSKVGGFFTGLFGGVSAMEKEGRAAAAQFQQHLHSTLNAQQQLEAGNESWKKTVIAVRDAYIAAGKTEQEALDIVAKLWKAEKEGGKGVAAVIAEIQSVMESGLKPATVAVGDEFTSMTTKATKGLFSTTEGLFTLEQATKQVTATGIVGFDELKVQIDQLAQDAIGTGNSGLTSAVQDLRIQMNEAAKSGVTDFSFMTSSIEGLKGRIATPITVPVKFDLGDMPNVSGWIDQFKAGLRETGYNNTDHLSPGNFETYEAWEANFLLRNPGDKHRAREAYGAGNQHVRGSAGGGLYSRPTFRVLAETRPEVVGEPTTIVDAFTKALRAVGNTGEGSNGNPTQIVVPIYLGGTKIDEHIIDVTQRGLTNGQLRVGRRNLVDQIGRT